MKPVYHSKYIEASIHAFNDIFAHLNTLPWLEATEARREYFMSLEPRSYTYGSGNGIRTYESKPFTGPVKLIQEILNTTTQYNYGIPCEYDVCFLNKYDGQKNHLGWHSDDSIEMDSNHPIAVVSFGVEREIWWKLKSHKGEIPKENKQLLEHGSLFVMPAGFQELYYHKIPKSDKPCGTRISLVFRKYKKGEDSPLNPL